MHRQVRGATHGRKVAGSIVVADAVHEFVDQILPAAHARGDAQAGQVAGFKAEISQRWHVRRRSRQTAIIRRRRILVQQGMVRMRVGRRHQRLHPGILVRREDRERPAGLGQHFRFLEDDLVLAEDQAPALGHQCAGDRGVPRHRGRLIVFIAEYSLHIELRCQPRYLGRCMGMADDQPAAVRAQFGIQLGQALVDEIDPAVSLVALCLQRIENFAVENENAVDGGGQAERLVQRGLIESTQVASEPDK